MKEPCAPRNRIITQKSIFPILLLNFEISGVNWFGLIECDSTVPVCTS